MEQVEGTAVQDFDRACETIEPPRLASPLVFSSPHSGSTYPQRFLAASRLDPLTLRRSEDAFVDELFLPCVGLGAPLLRALFPRAYLDVNREPYELDPQIFDGRLPDFANTRSLRVAVGLGTIPRVVGRRAANLQEADSGRRRSPPDRDAVPALSRAIEDPDRARARLVRGGGAARLPLDALERRRCQWTRYCAGRPIWRKRGAPDRRRSGIEPQARGLSRPPQ